MWSQRFGGTGTDVGTGVDVDASGNAFVVGYFQGTVNYGSGNAVSAGGDDIFLSSYNPSGVIQYVWPDGMGGTDRALCVVFRGYLRWGGMYYEANQVRNIAFVASETPLFWSQGFSSNVPGSTIEQARALAVDGAGDVYMIGRFPGSVTIGGCNTLISAGGSDVIVAKFTGATGACQWSQRFGGTAADQGNSIAVNAAGDVVVTGFFQNTINFGGGNLVSAGSHDIFVANFNTSGTHQWSTRYGGTGSDQANSVAIDPAGSIVVSGFFQGTVNFGGSDLVSAGSNDIFVAKYAAAGAHQWSQRFGGTGSDQVNSMAIGAPDHVFATGSFQSLVNFGGSNLASAGQSDIFVARYDAGGAHQWSARFGSTENDVGNSIALFATGHNIVTGTFTDTVNFGGDNLVSAGNTDVFIAKFANDLPSATGGPPAGYALAISSYPNPFNPQTTIRYTLPARGEVTVTIYDARGGKVVTLVDHVDQPAGAYSTSWNGHAIDGSPVSSGIYFARIEQNGAVQSKKITLLK